MQEHVAMATTSALIVGRHSPLMANTVFMTPGSMVLELLPFKWEWHNLSRLYYNMTQVRLQCLVVQLVLVVW